MDKNRNSWGAHGGALPHDNRKLFWARFFTLALLLTLSLTSLRSTASAQSCFQQCQQQYSQCLAAELGLICDIMYDSCIEDCNGASRPSVVGTDCPGAGNQKLIFSPPGRRFTSPDKSRNILDSFGVPWLVEALNGGAFSPHQKRPD